ncbi:hypothetical protein DF141_06375 [Burkholderia cenocepacia]|nr:hypothetical protein DF141_06375 [Burkholderia cenocepacia]
MQSEIEPLNFQPLVVRVISIEFENPVTYAEIVRRIVLAQALECSHDLHQSGRDVDGLCAQACQRASFW